MNQQPIVVLGLLFLTVAQSGCGVNSETLDSFQSAVESVSAARASSAPSEDMLDEQELVTSEVAFKPLHPNRIDPFHFPESADLEYDGGAANDSLSTAAQIEILGFANVGTQHVLIRSGDRTRSLKVGEAIDGIRVVSINPPLVQLQMGTLMWNATMFDKGNGQ